MLLRGINNNSNKNGLNKSPSYSEYKKPFAYFFEIRGHEGEKKF
jgi:hypothetical protein